MSNPIRSVAIVGTGQMGPGIAVSTTLAGLPTTLVGRTEDSLRRGRAGYERALAFLREQRAVRRRDARRAAALLTLSGGLPVAGGVDLVIESITERLDAKQELFAELDARYPDTVVLASNTSGLRITDIAERMHRPQRAVTTHFWNPGHLMPLVEVIQGERTAGDTVERVVGFLRRCGKQPVVGRRDVPGQICNRILQAVIRECVYMVEQGIASAQDVETALKHGAGLRFPVYGPLEHLDAIGLDLGLAVQTTVLPSLCNASVPGALLRDLVRGGNLGASTGRGFHDWSRRSVDELRRARDLWLVERMKERQG